MTTPTRVSLGERGRSGWRCGEPGAAVSTCVASRKGLLLWEAPTSPGMRHAE